MAEDEVKIVATEGQAEGRRTRSQGEEVTGGPSVWSLGSWRRAGQGDGRAGHWDSPFRPGFSLQKSPAWD